MNRQTRPKNLLMTAITIYVLLLASVLAVVLIVNLTDTTPRIRRDIDASNLSRIANIHQLSDRALREIDRTSLSLVDSSDIRRILLDDMRPSYPRAQSLENFKKVTSNVSTLHELVAHVATYSESSQYLYTLGYYMPVAEFPDQSWREYYEDKSFHGGWIGTRDTQWIQYGSYETYPETLITFIRMYPLYASAGQRRGAIMLHIRMEDFKKLLHYNVEDETEVLVVDGEGNIIVGNAHHPFGTQIGALLDLGALLDMAAKGEGLQAQQNDVTLRAYASSSSYTGWHYVMLVNESVAFRAMVNMRIVLLWTATILLLIGIVSLLMMKRWVYTPIQGFIGELHKSLNQHSALAPNYALSFDAMAERFSDIVTDRERMMNQLTVSLPAIRKQLFLDILMGYADSYEATRPQMDYVDMQLYPANYVVILLDVRPDRMMPIVNRAMVHALLELVDRELAGGCTTCAASLDNGLIACILSFPKDAPKANLQHSMALARRLTDAVRTDLVIDAIAGVGGHYTDFEDIRLSYQEALEALKLNPFFEHPNAVMKYDEDRPENTGAAHALLSEMDAVMDALRAGDNEGLLKHLSTFGEQVAQAALPPQAARALYRMIQLQAASIAMEAGADQDHAFQERTMAARQAIEAADALASLHEAAQALLQYYTDVMRRQRGDTALGHNQAEAIRAYLAAHYADPMLSQASTADALGLSPSYLSRLFRQTTGESFTEALANIRTEQAKVLLRQPHASVNIVAEQTGYLSPHTFIRTFKRVTGITPGRWMKDQAAGAEAD